MTEKPILSYKDTWGQFSSMADMALARVRNPGPMLGGVMCPAWENTFAVSENGGATWRNPTQDERNQLARAIRDTGECCQKSMESCTVRM